MLLVILAVVIIRSVVLGRGSKETPQFTAVSREDIQEGVTASGVLVGVNNALLKFQSGGKLAYLGVKPGDRVKKGQVIARLDTQALGIALQQAQNNLRDKEAVIAKIYDDLKDAGVFETYAQRTLRTTAEVAKDNAYDTVRAAKRAFQDAVIISPLSGLVTDGANLIAGQNVTPADLVAQVSNFSDMVFETDVDEADIGKIKLDQNAEISLDSYSDKRFEGKVFQIMSIVKTTTSGASTITVKIKLKKSELLPIYGLNGSASIITSEKSSALVIPIEALIGENEVYVMRQKPEKVKVSTGIMSDTSVEILDGLAEGDRVVTNPNVVN